MIIELAHIAAGDLSGQVAVITGAGSGIGRETARILAHLGAKVVIAEVSDIGRQVEQEIRAAGGEALFVQTDVSDPDSVGRLAATVHHVYGRADILINNAYVSTFKRLWDHSLVEWDRVMAVNLRGAFLCIQAFLPGMLERRSGVVVTMESAEGMPYAAPYFASKVGLRSLAYSLAAEVGEDAGVAVFCFGAGAVDTPGLTRAMDEMPALYGISREEFVRMTGEGLISPELCATGLAGTVLHAREFHGQQVGHGSGLTRLGLGADGRPPAPGGEAAGGAEAGTQAAEAGTQAAAARSAVPALPADGSVQAVELNRQLVAILSDNVREYAELPLFQRTVVRRMFQQATGLKVEDWLAIARAMSPRLEGGSPDPAALASYRGRLKRLGDYIARQEHDARGYFRDPEKLRVALAALAARLDAVRRLEAALAELPQG